MNATTPAVNITRRLETPKLAALPMKTDAEGLLEAVLTVLFFETTYLEE